MTVNVSSLQQILNLCFKTTDKKINKTEGQIFGTVIMTGILVFHTKMLRFEPKLNVQVQLSINMHVGIQQVRGQGLEFLPSLQETTLNPGSGLQPGPLLIVWGNCVTKPVEQRQFSVPLSQLNKF